MNNINNNIENKSHVFIDDNSDINVVINENDDENIKVFITNNDNNTGTNNENNENNTSINNDNNEHDVVRKISFKVQINYARLDFLNEKIDGNRDYLSRLDKKIEKYIQSDKNCNNDYRFIFIALFFIYLVITEFIPWLLRLL